jgi:hypothetical protein
MRHLCPIRPESSNCPESLRHEVMEQSGRAEKIITNYCVPAALKTGKQCCNDLIGHSFFGCVTTHPFVHLYVSRVEAATRCNTPDLNAELHGFVSENCRTLQYIPSYGITHSSTARNSPGLYNSRLLFKKTSTNHLTFINLS